MRGTTDTSDIQVESHVPMPPRALPVRESKYPFADMAVDDSFFVPMEDKKRTVMACYGYSKRRGGAVKFQYRTVTEDGVAGIRVWRTA